MPEHVYIQIGRLTLNYMNASGRLWQRFGLVKVLGNIYCICTRSSGIVNLCFACLDGKRWFASILQIK